MSSFVNEVLTTAGQLQKEEVTAKLSQLSKRIQQVKVDVHDVLGSKYADFKPSLSVAFELDSQVKNLSDDMHKLTEKIESEVKNKLNVSTTEFNDLRTQLAESNGILAILEKLVQINDALQASDRALKIQEFPVAADHLQIVQDVLTELSKTPRSGEIKLLDALKVELCVQHERLINDLNEAWSEKIKWTIPDTNEVNVVVELNIVNTDNRKILTSVVKGMEKVNSRLLETKLSHFGEHFFTHIVKRILNNRAVANVNGSLLKITYQLQNDDTALPSEVFTNLDLVFNMLNKQLLGISLKDASDSGSVMEKFGAVIGSKFTKILIKECLAPSVPTNHKELDKYHQVISVTEQFYQKLVKIKFLPASDTTLLDYVKNINVLFANKKCQEILERSRQLMTSDIHNTVRISRDESPREVEPLGKVTVKKEKPEEQAAMMVSQPKFTAYRLPSCCISTSVQTLMMMAYETLQEATVSSPLCAVQLFYCVRNMFELFCGIVPTYHRDSLSKLPQLTAIHHNNCMYIAHHLLTLGHQFSPKLSESLIEVAPTFVDLVPKLRQLGTDIFLQQMQAQKGQIIEYLKGAQGFDGVAEDQNYGNCERAIKQSLHLLHHLSKVWNEVLPENIFHKSIGTLLSATLLEIVSNVTALEDISADDATQLHTLLTILHDKASELFLSKDEANINAAVLLFKYVPKWQKFSELMLVLNASLQDISDRWADGKGPLGNEFTPNEIKQLIRALFQNTDRRANVLAKIR